MSLRVLKEIRAAVANLNPEEVRAAAERPLTLGLVASSEAAFQSMEEFLLPSEKVSYRKRVETSALLHRNGDTQERFDLVLCEDGIPCPQDAFTFYPEDAMLTVHEILAERDELSLALARNFYPFRQPVVDRIIHSLARDNALSALVTALPNTIPSISGRRGPSASSPATQPSSRSIKFAWRS